MRLFSQTYNMLPKYHT